jgi:sensor c-di-GMP phosphodiesterase-like protein
VKLGFIPVNVVTNHILFLAVFVEIFLISGVLLLNLRTSKRAFKNQEVTNNLSLLPNDIALERQLKKSTFAKPVSLFQVWISGFDGLQTTLGTKMFSEFLQGFGKEAQRRLDETSFLNHTRTSQDTARSLFHSDQNTFIVLSRQLNKEDQDLFLDIIETSINKVIDELHEHFDFKVSIGAYVFDNAQQDFEIIIKNSVLALSQGIKNGSSFTYYTEHIGFNEARRNQLINDFYRSLLNGEFFLLWQPQYDTVKDTISGVEVLARWNHAELGMIGPDEFIPLLEQSHRISDLTKWVINKVFKELPLLHESSSDVEVSINLSTRDLSNGDLIEMLDQKLETNQHLVPYITMEITESMMIDDYQVVLNNVNKLQERGFKVSIDDFGSGYASFSYLQSLPANELKIDRCYTERFEEPRTSAILESVIDLAKSLNMIIVVEGVESTQQVERFTKLGVDRLQGWAMGKPMSLDDLILKTS